MSARVTSPVLVGRRDELGVLGGVLDRAAAGEFAVAVIGGEAGIGKTRLSLQAGEQARRQGFTVLVGGCLDIGESTVPYAPLLEALRQLWAEFDSDALTDVLGPASAELGSLVPELGPPMAAGAAPGPGRVFELLRGVLHRLAQRQPVLVIIEDLHWADHGTRDLLRYLSRNLHAPAAVSDRAIWPSCGWSLYSLLGGAAGQIVFEHDGYFWAIATFPAFDDAGTVPETSVRHSGRNRANSRRQSGAHSQRVAPCHITTLSDRANRRLCARSRR